MIRKAIILPYKLNSYVQRHWESKFPSRLYAKHGPCTLGDKKIPVKEGETAIEVFSDEAIKFMEKFTEMMEVNWVDVFWKNS